MHISMQIKKSRKISALYFINSLSYLFRVYRTNRSIRYIPKEHDDRYYYDYDIQQNKCLYDFYKKFIIQHFFNNFLIPHAEKFRLIISEYKIDL